MFTIEQLTHLTAFDEYGTLSKAAENLHISQPVLTRSMQRLEEELGVPLFQRTKNRMTLNENGKTAVRLAQRILDEADSMKTTLQTLERSRHTIILGSCAPAPSILLAQKAPVVFPNMIIQNEVKDIDTLQKGLHDDSYSAVVLPFETEEDDIECIPFLEEQLYFSLPQDHPLAEKQEIALSEMDGERMLRMSDVGFWNRINSHMPHTKFLMQQDRTVFYDLIELSVLPSFTSDFMLKLDGKPENRIVVPISDEDAHATYWCTYRKEKEEMLKPLLYRLNV